MEDTRPFRFGLFTFGLVASGSLIAIAVFWFASSTVDFKAAQDSGNCRLSLNIPTTFGPTFCVPQSLQLAIMAFAVSYAALCGLAVNRTLATRREFRNKLPVTFTRFGIAALVVGAIIDFQMFFVLYATQYRGYLALATMLFATAMVGKFTFPQTNLLPLILLVLPLAVVGFFAGVLLAVMTGMGFWLYH